MGTLSYLRGIALDISSRISKFFPRTKCIGEWTLSTTPTTFNRTVTGQSPAIACSEDDFLKLVNPRKNYVKLKGRIMQDNYANFEDVVFRRVCIHAEDGGMLSLDWPSNLNLEEQSDWKCTILIIPGTVEGSRERKIRGFVRDCLSNRVGFPIVMNPRGCAGSPVSTPRLFTAADSYDIFVAVQFIIRKRSGTTLMAVGWECGANMLTKYLAEFGNKTQIVAASCIDNPFDLEEAAMASVRHRQGYDLRQTTGLIKMLEHNKELFQVEEIPFDVESALSASSIREFEEAISMFSHGFDDIEDFYLKSSSRYVINKVKVPVLFIQNGGIRVPFYFIPRSEIMDNPFTSILSCSYNPSSKFVDDILTFSWCHCFILEWLNSVKLVLQNDFHPPNLPALEPSSPTRVEFH